MSITNDEINRLAAALNSEHSPEVLQFASTMMFFQSLAGDHGQIGDRNMHLLSHMVAPYMREHGITLDQVDRAIQGLRRANVTLSLIASYGD